MLATIEVSEANLTNHIESLKYASIIQRGLLPKKRHFNRHFSDHFVLFKPLNFVSGDFYWVGGKDGLIFAAVGDCTGHGVPGAMLSILARNILEYSIMTKSFLSTDRVLRELDKKFIESFFHVREEEYNNDWVDIALICIDKKRSVIEFSSANRKILHVGKNGAEVYSGSSYPIGGWQVERNRRFDRVTIPFEPGDAIYLGSDGYQDQIGGERLKKFSSRRLHDLLQDNYEHPMKKQKIKLVKELAKWQGKEEQIDDICLMGLRI
jgi:serine phosphatase RsbU (regulator of sigma subunit)